MSQIIFFCPPVSVINGGIKYIFRMAESLHELGQDAVVFEENGRRPAWFPSMAPVVGQGAFKRGLDQVLVLPEDQPNILSTFKDWPNRKVIYCQNHFYSALGAGGALSYADYGIEHLICSSRTIYEHARVRYPLLKAYLVPYGVNQALFRPAAIRRNTIAFMPRKRPIEAAYLCDMFRFTYPEYRDWKWDKLSNLSEIEVARAMSEARVFLSLSKLEGFGLTPLEAMAAGCVIAGFTGIGGREYATPENGFWAEEDDFPACLEQLKKAVTLSLDEGGPRAAYAESCQKTLARYTPEVFKAAVGKVWQQILA